MTVAVNLWIVIGIILYLAIGGGFAYRLSISTSSAVALVLAWPLFAVLMLLAWPINRYLNRNF